ncbi:MAG TPA: beta-N-acetylhexosaminidase [Gemmatimonadales bacterium]|nr:beta-N-acetylhexosaminidase [Gemmatimonadales bacterium]
MIPSLLLALTVTLQAPTDSIAIIPRPVTVVRHPGHFTLRPRTAIMTTEALKPLAVQLAAYLRPATGYDFVVTTSNRIPDAVEPDPAIIILGLDSLLSGHGPESYSMDVTSSSVVIQGATPAAVFYGIQSLRQLLPPEIFRKAPVGNVRWTFPCLSIVDYPRFSWRGMHLDVSRHFMPKEFVEKYIDLISLYKFNRFHWHLTDDQGWRIEITRYPRLTSVGGWRARTLVGKEPDDTSRAVYDSTRHGGFYTQEDIREVVAYARARFVTIVPEIEMPGHSQAAISAYPELGSTGQPVKVKEDWGVSEWILSPSDSTLAFMENVLTEVMGLFPGKWIHTGGDEAVKTQWKASPLAQERIKSLGLKDEDALQGWFTARVDSFLAAHGRTLIGWDEILDGGLSPNAVVMSWRGIDGGVAAAKAGHDVVMAPGDYTYFDHYQTGDRDSEPLAIGGFLPLDSVYSYDPVPAGLTPEQARHILGAQGQIWTEYIPDPKHVEYMAFPRLEALAEALWIPRGTANFDDFFSRLSGADVARLDALDVHYRTPALVTAVPPKGGRGGHRGGPKPRSR